MRERDCLGYFVAHYYSGWAPDKPAKWITSRAKVCVRRGCGEPNPWLDEGDLGVDMPEQSEGALAARLQARAKRQA